MTSRPHPSNLSKHLSTGLSSALLLVLATACGGNSFASVPAPAEGEDAGRTPEVDSGATVATGGASSGDDGSVASTGGGGAGSGGASSGGTSSGGKVGVGAGGHVEHGDAGANGGAPSTGGASSGGASSGGASSGGASSGGSGGVGCDLGPCQLMEASVSLCKQFSYGTTALACPASSTPPGACGCSHDIGAPAGGGDHTWCCTPN